MNEAHKFSSSTVTWTICFYLSYWHCCYTFNCSNHWCSCFLTMFLVIFPHAILLKILKSLNQDVLLHLKHILILINLTVHGIFCSSLYQAYNPVKNSNTVLPWTSSGCSSQSSDHWSFDDIHCNCSCMTLSYFLSCTMSPRKFQAVCVEIPERSRY
jgi:hypothetical protein